MQANNQGSVKISLVSPGYVMVYYCSNWEIQSRAVIRKVIPIFFRLQWLEIRKAPGYSSVAGELS